MYDFGDAAPSFDNSPGHWQRSLPHPFVQGNGRFVPPSNKRMMQIAASAGGYIRIARQCRFLVIIYIINWKLFASSERAGGGWWWLWTCTIRWPNSSCFWSTCSHILGRIVKSHNHSWVSSHLAIDLRLISIMLFIVTLYNSGPVTQKLHLKWIHFKIYRETSFLKGCFIIFPHNLSLFCPLSLLHSSLDTPSAGEAGGRHYPGSTPDLQQLQQPSNPQPIPRHLGPKDRAISIIQSSQLTAQSGPDVRTSTGRVRTHGGAVQWNDPGHKNGRTFAGIKPRIFSRRRCSE